MAEGRPVKLEVSCKTCDWKPGEDECPLCSLNEHVEKNPTHEGDCKTIYLEVSNV